MMTGDRRRLAVVYIFFILSISGSLIGWQYNGMRDGRHISFEDATKVVQ